MAPYIAAFKLSDGDISVEHPGAEKASDVNPGLFLRIVNTRKRARDWRALNPAAVPDEELAKLMKDEHLAVSALAGSASPDDLAARLTASLTAVVDPKFVDFKQDVDAKFVDINQYVDAKFVDFKQDVDAKFVDIKQDVDDKFADFKQYPDDKFAEHEELLSVRHANVFARIYNSRVRHDGKLKAIKKERRPSSPSRAALGAVPPSNIPLAALNNLNALTDAQIDELEEFYEEEFAGQDVVARQEALGVFLGANV
ncbi:hypothetical protein HYH03_016159 [Edaphochlamys debaryana]|uniref:Uncharacterized protein n=1 Tax=Edaphochlamys debaryana TaxID=47281 RepID=A0A835XKT6_9CHLO|nr:hypothetical protein HYH03_016159 [Edaphochlamys debaryana]|eukprot:KAG2485062.1 hypothetical protein HYH03_016159 [Edaphochlamys debaryana]